jgi:multidrug transporter EmrE-like cation transporter
MSNISSSEWWWALGIGIGLILMGWSAFDDPTGQALICGIPLILAGIWLIYYFGFRDDIG